MDRDKGQDGGPRPFKVGRLLFNADKAVLSFSQQHLGSVFEPDGEFRCVGILDGSDNLVTGACFHFFVGSGAMMTGASSRPGRWTTRKVMAGLFAYAFESLELHRITCLVAEDNLASARWCEKAGFKVEGRLRQGATDHSDLMVYGMLEADCRWLHGQEKQRSTEGTKR